jgi:hypothetical protein
VIDFDWGNGSPSPLVPVDYFSARWTGTLTALYSETYTIYVPSDNGVRVWLNNNLILDKWTPTDISGWHNFTIPLTSGQAIPIKVEYAELYGGANISLYWFSNTQSWEAINTNRLTPAVVIPPNSAEAAPGMIARTQALTTSPPNLPAQIIQYSDGTDDVSLTVPTPASTPGSPARRYFRVHMVVPDPS